MSNYDPFGKEAHDQHNPEHSGLCGHECYGGWDGLYICEDCREFEFCECEGKDVDYDR